MLNFCLVVALIYLGGGYEALFILIFFFFFFLWPFWPIDVFLCTHRHLSASPQYLLSHCNFQYAVISNCSPSMHNLCIKKELATLKHLQDRNS